MSQDDFIIKIWIKHIIIFYTRLLFYKISISHKPNTSITQKYLQYLSIITENLQRIKKSLKCKQRLYIKFQENRNSKNELEYRNYNKLFESIEKCAKINYILSLIRIKIILKNLDVIKGAIGEKRSNNQNVYTKKSY